jgi:protein-disulfide isomerase
MLIKIALWLFPFMMANNLFAQKDCAPIPSDVADRLATFVHDKFQFAPETVIKVASSEVITPTCYRKVRFLTEGSGPSEAVFYLSPDQRFLSRDLLDSTIDLAAEKKAMIEKQRTDGRIMQARLNSGKFPSKGLDTAPITLTIFSDFQCPFCRQQAEILEELNDTQVRVVFRNLPLSFHEFARPAAESAACIYRQSNDAFWFLHDALFREQPQLTSTNLQNFIHATLAKRTDIDLRPYDACVANHETAEEVDRDLAFARENKLEATPTVFINGVRRNGIMRAAEVQSLADILTAEAGTADKNQPR